MRLSGVLLLEVGGWASKPHAHKTRSPTLGRAQGLSQYFNPGRGAEGSFERLGAWLWPFIYSLIAHVLIANCLLGQMGVRRGQGWESTPGAERWTSTDSIS